MGANRAISWATSWATSYAALPKAQWIFSLFLLGQQRVRWTGSPKVKHRGFSYSHHPPDVIKVSHTLLFLYSQLLKR